MCTACVYAAAGNNTDGINVYFGLISAATEKASKEEGLSSRAAKRRRSGSQPPCMCDLRCQKRE